jgi:hypothetical protein
MLKIASNYIIIFAISLLLLVGITFYYIKSKTDSVFSDTIGLKNKLYHFIDELDTQIMHSSNDPKNPTMKDKLNKILDGTSLILDRGYTLIDEINKEYIIRGSEENPNFNFRINSLLNETNNILAYVNQQKNTIGNILQFVNTELTTDGTKENRSLYFVFKSKLIEYLSKMTTLEDDLQSILGYYKQQLTTEGTEENPTLKGKIDNILNGTFFVLTKGYNLIDEVRKEYITRGSVKNPNFNYKINLLLNEQINLFEYINQQKNTISNILNFINNELTTDGTEENRSLYFVFKSKLIEYLSKITKLEDDLQSILGYYKQQLTTEGTEENPTLKGKIDNILNGTFFVLTKGYNLIDEINKEYITRGSEENPNFNYKVNSLLNESINMLEYVNQQKNTIGNILNFIDTELTTFGTEENRSLYFVFKNKLIEGLSKITKLGDDLQSILGYYKQQLTTSGTEENPTLIKRIDTLLKKGDKLITNIESDILPLTDELLFQSNVLAKASYDGGIYSGFFPNAANIEKELRKKREEEKKKREEEKKKELELGTKLNEYNYLFEVQ